MDTTMNINQEKLNASIRYLNKMGDRTVESLREAAPEVSERLEHLGELLKDEEFCNQFVTSESKEAAAKMFTDRGFDITDEELTALATRTRDLVYQLMENGGELNEEELERVAGGAEKYTTWSEVGKAVGLGVAAGLAVGTGVSPGIGTLVGAGVGAAVSLVTVGASVLFNWLGLGLW